MSWNGQVKAHFQDVAGYTPKGFADVSATFDSWPVLFNEPNAGQSFNDAVRMGLEVLGHGIARTRFEEEARSFSNWGALFGTSRSLNAMLREWADDYVSGVCALDFDEITETFDSIPNDFGGPPRVSINTALRLALTSPMTPVQTFDKLSNTFDSETRAFGGFDSGISINTSVKAQFTGTTFGDPTRENFEVIGATFDSIEMTFGGQNLTGNVNTFDRESRRFEMIG